jgi:hypothetical protein
MARITETAMDTPRTPQGVPQTLLWPFSTIFSSPEIPHANKIAIATGRLATALQFAIDAVLIELWKQILDQYTDDELARAFERAQSQISAFPAPAHLVGYIEKARCADAFAMVLKGIPRFTTDWQAKQPWATRERNAEDRLVDVWHKGEPAPELSPKLTRTLELFGHVGTVKGGLVRLKRDHPAFWTGDTEFTTGQHGRQASAIERDFYQAWMEA